MEGRWGRCGHQYRLGHAHPTPFSSSPSHPSKNEFSKMGIKALRRRGEGRNGGNVLSQLFLPHFLVPGASNLAPPASS